MATSRIVTATGNINGVNAVFSVGEAVEPGSMRYILNGRIHGPGTGEDYIFAETAVAIGEITVTVPPADGDTVQIFFVDRRSTGVAAQRLQGSIQAASTPLTGTLRTGAVAAPPALTGRLR